MIGDGIHEDALAHLVYLNAVREFLVGRDVGGLKWTVSVRVGGPSSPLVAVRSRRAGLAETGADSARSRHLKLDLTPQSAGLYAISLGLSQTFANDHDMLRQGLVMYDALYA
ncbi:chromate resistance protein ChrB domain-containing protein [Pseudomonas sp. LB3P81]